MKYIRFLKNILIIVCLSLSLISSFSKCQAYTWDEFCTLVENYQSYEGLNQTTIEGCRWFINNKQNIINRLNSWYLGAIDPSNFSNFVMYRDGNLMYLVGFQNGDGIIYHQNRFYKPNGIDNFMAWGNYSKTNYNEISAEPKGIINYNGYSVNMCAILTDIPPQYTIPTTTITVANLGPSIDFITYNDGNISVYYNGSSDTFLKYNLSRSVKSWSLGRLDGFDDSMKIDVRLNRYMNRGIYY